MINEQILFKGSLLWDGLGKEMVRDGCIVTEGKKIKNIFTYSSTDNNKPDFDRFYDFHGLTLMPGMIDCHTHHSLDASKENYLDRMNDSIPELVIRATILMKIDLKSGVTTCRTLGDKEYLDIACREAINNGLLEGPCSIVAGKGIRAAGAPGVIGFPYKGKDEIRAAIKENLKVGADLIKLYISGTLKDEGDLPSYLSREEIESAISDSHKAGVRVAAHCVGGIGLDWALDCGLDSIEHAYYINNAQIENLAKSRTHVVLTLSPILNDEIVNNYPKPSIPRYFLEQDEISARLHALINAGIPFALGTDGMHGGLAMEAQYASMLGADNLRILQAATITGAKVCGIENETGSLLPGKYADFIAVEGNPLENIGALKNVRAVIKQGRLIYLDDLLV